MTKKTLALVNGPKEGLTMIVFQGKLIGDLQTNLFSEAGKILSSLKTC